MKKNLKCLLAGFLAAVIPFGLAACSAGGNSDETYVRMNYSTGIAENGEYNTELYGMNCVSDVDGADPGVIYVSEDESEEYGGYYYMYTTGSISYTENGETVLSAFPCYRSKNLYNWENAGAVTGSYALYVKSDDWCAADFWAPEVIRNPADGKYYMYFSASLHANYGVSGFADTGYSYDRLYLGVAVADTPAGPFSVINDMDAATGKHIPTINFQTGCNLDTVFAAIDASPFFDDNGDLYLYFNKHNDSAHSNFNSVWGMKMNSMTAPDYSTVTALLMPGYTECANGAGEMTALKGAGTSTDRQEGDVNEGPFMLKHNGKYYLTYSSEGYTSTSYSVWQAVSDSPLSGFVKMSFAEGNPVLDGSLRGYMGGTGHHCFVSAGDNLYIVYHRHTTADEWSGERVISADRVNFTTNANGDEVLVTNGPSTILSWLPESVSGYENLAQVASVSMNNGTGIEYLVDGILPYATVEEYNVMTSESGDVTITLSWDKPVDVSSIMIYNAGYMEQAFSKISNIRFKLAETPTWANMDYTYAVIENVEVPERFCDADTNYYVACVPTVAEFDSICVTEITITILECDRLMEFDKLGNENLALELSEIVVLGSVR